MPEPKYYRNSMPIGGIDPWGLWERRSNTMILVDDDQYLTVEYSQDDFVEASHADAINLHEANDEG